MLARSAPLRRVIRLTRCLPALLALTMVIAAPADAHPATANPATANPDARTGDAGSIGVRLVDAPVSTAGDPRARAYIVDHVAPGTVIHRRVEVSNTTSSTAQVLLYPAAASIAKGSFLVSAGHTPNDLSTWTFVRPGASDVPAGGRITATVTVTVPRDAPPAEQYAVVWAEVRSTPIAGGVTQVSRVGIRLYVSIGPGGAPAANFTIDSVTAERAPDGRPMILSTVHNTGGRALDMSGSLQLLAGPGGLRAGPFPAILGTTLAIGAREAVTTSLDGRLPAGPWEVQITLRSGLLERTARATITFPTKGASPPVSTSTEQPGWLYPAISGLLALLLLAITALLVVLRRARSRPVQT